MSKIIKEEIAQINEIFKSDEWYRDYVMLRSNTEAFREILTEAIIAKCELSDIHGWKVTCNGRNNTAKIINGNKLVFSLAKKSKRLKFNYDF